MCLSGMYCSGVGLTEPTGDCGAGYVCYSGAAVQYPMDETTGWICPSGQYCPSGSGSGLDCPSGTFNNQTGLVAVEQCQECTPGYYCASPGLSMPSGPCYAGYYCTGGAVTPDPIIETYGAKCTQGQHCPEGSSSPQPCPVGTYSSLFGNDMISDCMQCDPGRYCSQQGLTNYTGLCAPGYYCVSGANVSQPVDGVTGDICPEGYYCPAGSSNPIVCEMGSYMPQQGASECLPCPTGLRCINGMAGICLPGYYCPGSTGYTPEACPIGTYSNSMNLTDETDCSPCPPGQYCSMPASTSPGGSCDVGFYCTSGVSTSQPVNGDFIGVGGICPLGHYCPEMSGTPSPCLAGTYADEEGLEECKTCPPSYFCPAGATDFASTPCPAGHYCPSGTQFANEHPCNAGTYNNLTLQSSEGVCVDCLPGMYCIGMGNSLPTGPCDPGWYCLGSAVTNRPNDTVTGNICPVGFYCPEGSPQPVSCSLGMYCSDNGLDEPTGNCAEGFFCSGNATLPNPSTSLCPAGHYCLSGTTTPVGCPPGYFSNAEGNRGLADCTNCTPGYYCAANGLTSPTGMCDSGYYCPEGQSSSTAFLCPRGHFCGNGSGVPTPCPSGFYQPSEGAAMCESCPEGTYCDATALDLAGCTERFQETVGVYNPAVCPQGHYCLLGTSRANQYPCPEGTFSNKTGLTDVSNCSACSGGYYCASRGLIVPTGQCSGGHYCIEGASIPNPIDDNTGDVCGKGFYCPAGSTHELKCPMGTFNNDTGLQDETECSACWPGYYCDQEGLVLPTGECSEGYYCSLRSTESAPVNASHGDICYSGHYCPQGTGVPKQCPPGTFYNTTGAFSIDDCFLCPPGMYCEGSGIVQPTGLCSEGFYCLQGANTSTPIDGSTGDVCPIGNFCPLGSALPQACSDGTYMNHTQAALCYECPAGYQCTRMTTADPCPQGYYCPAGTGSELPPCPVGSYNPMTGLSNISQCTPCTPGHYCQHTGISSPTGICSAGHYCTQGVNTSSPTDIYTGEGGICTTAHYCPNGTVTPIGCPAGTFSNQTGLSECLECPAGFYCLSSVMTYQYTQCPIGHYCPSGTTFAEQYPCPNGTYNNMTGAQNINSCVSCPPGMYCEGEGNPQPTGPCDAGWYCSGGTAVSRPMEYNNAMMYQNNTGDICPVGSFCPQGSSTPHLCTAGEYCAQTGLSSPTGLCLAGYYCDQGSTMANQTSCSEGRYCPEGTAVPIPCPLGTFSPNTGNSMRNDCLSCTPGYSCSSMGLTEPNEMCSEGYYCPRGQVTSTPVEYVCPLGHFCPENSSQPIGCFPGTYQDQLGQEQCKICPAGFYCDSFENCTANVTDLQRGTITPLQCPSGYYCPEGTEYGEQFACPAGTFNNITGLHDVSQCMNCTAGDYCDVAGLTTPSGPCDPGYVCYQSAISPTPTDGTTGDVCPLGGFCPQGSSTSILCPAGTYNSQTGLHNVSQCVACAPGKYCDTIGLSLPAGDCSMGYYCTLGSTIANPSNETFGDICPPGNYCPQRTHTPIQCPPGTFRNTTGGTSIEECSSCLPGYFCGGYGLSSVSGPCSAGYYCTLGANDSTPVDGLKGDICPIGHYCPVGSVLPRECIAGTYSNVTGVEACLVCPGGFFCVRGDEPDICTAGNYCPQGTGVNIQPCPRGTYSNQQGLSDEAQCRPCDGGYYCETEGSTNVTGLCSAGYYCEQGVDTSTPSGGHRGTGGECPISHMCPEGSVNPLSCAAGTYQDETGQSMCKICPSGFYCLANSSTYSDVCPSGHFCPEGTEYSTQYPCPIGTYNGNTGRANKTDCVLCDGGSYCDARGLSQPTGNCSVGYYCTLGAVSSMPQYNLSEAYQLMLMGSPVYSFINETGDVCPVGHFCPEASVQPEPCSPGMYCPQEALAEPAGLCHAGYYCPSGAHIPTYLPCTPGYYCPNGTSVQLECPPGTYSNTSLNTQLNDCLSCTPGHYCASYGLTTPTNMCDPGFYCPGGQSTSHPDNLACTPGHFCLAGSHNQTGCPAGEYQPNWAASSCLQCPEAYYCDPNEASCLTDYNFTLVCSSEIDIELSSAFINTEGVVTPKICPTGSYCPVGTEFSTQFLCPEGTYSNETGLWNISQCISCPPGMFCAGEGLTSPSGLCSPGYFCNEDASTATPMDDITGGECPRGRYCLAGSTITASSCPKGTFNNRTGLSNISECQFCPPGYYCPYTGLVEPFGLCNAGYYCIGGSPVSNPSNVTYGDQCISGHYCPIGTASPIPCPVGSFLPTTGATSLSECLPCSSGMYCEYSGQSNVTGLCSAGYYCTSNSSTPTPIDGITGNVCPNSSYCPVGSSQPLTCPNATYMNHTGAESCYICPEGHYCVGTDEAILCPQGYYCGTGTGLDWEPCPKGTYGSREGLSSVNQCILCPGGYYCDSSGAINVSGSCSDGYYCTIAVTIATPTQGNDGNGSYCPIGHYCPEMSSMPLPCEAGSYAPVTGLSLCYPCLQGYYCPEGSHNTTDNLCPPGYFCPEGTGIGTENPCPSGTYNPYYGAANSSDCLHCPGGMFCEGTANTMPTGNCSGGHYCASGASSAMPNLFDDLSISPDIMCADADITGGRCYPGSYCPDTSSFPLACTPGMFCSDPGLSAPSGPCQEGFYCNGSDTSPTPDDKHCPQGHYCPRQTASPLPCPTGTYSNQTGNQAITDCLPCLPGYVCNSEATVYPTYQCSPGYYCPEGQNVSTPTMYMCPIGYSCPTGSSQPVGCESGFYQDEVGQENCNVCPEGYYCDSTVAAVLYNTSGIGVITPLVCPAGFYCPNRTAYSTQFPCPSGSFSNATMLTDSSQCVQCSGGMYCASEGLTTPTAPCAESYFCLLGSSVPNPTDGTTGDICPAGFYCPRGSQHGTPCPLGTFSNDTGLQQEAQCIPCSPGMYCPTSGLTAPTGDCLAGYYCIIGSSFAAPVNQSFGSLCPAGHYCEAGSPTPTECPQGTFLPSEGAASASDCLPCTPGYYCAETGQPNVTAPCSAGHYCSLGATTSTPTDNVTGGVCFKGHYCMEGSAVPTACSNSTYSNITGAESCLVCPEGFFCVRGDEPDICTAGNYCPQGTGVNIQLCPRGTYSNQQGLSDVAQCRPCDGGYYCETEGSTNVSGLCSAGYYCEQGVDTSTPSGAHRGIGGKCPIGHMCPEGSATPSSCLAGTYQDQMCQESCKDCPGGYFCLTNSSTFVTFDCPSGYYCPNGTKHAFEFPCPAGTYNPSNNSDNINDCLLCPPGMYCQVDGLSVPSGVCDGGYYCSNSSTTATPVATEIDNVTNPLSVYDSCPYFTLQSNGDRCPIGFFCPQGSAEPTICPAGMFCGRIGLVMPEGLCDAGYYCDEGSIDPQERPCSVGHYCLEGTDVEVDCPPGTFSNRTHNQNVTDCFSCTPGMFCSGRELTEPSGYCSAGYYCPAGQSTSTPELYMCTPGHFCPEGTPEQLGCPSGYYQQHSRKSVCDVCPEGYYCNAYNDYNDSYVVDLGDGLFVNYSRSQLGVSTPVLCPEGSYCPNETRYATENLCPLGTFSNTTGLSSNDQCTMCLAGKYCDVEGATSPSGLCAEGYVCISGAFSSTPSDNITGGLCPKGRYCPAGSISGISCPVGTFNALLGIANQSQCQSCTPGYYCPIVGLRSSFGVCDASHICWGGSSTQNPVDQVYGDWCPTGNYCPQGTSTPIPCPVGSYSPNVGGRNVSDCLPCLPGYYCSGSGQSNVTGMCSAGYYCTSNSNTPTPIDGITGNVCPNSSYCPVGSSQPLTCPNATYMNHTGAESCYICPEGHYCVGTDEAIPCPQGYYCGTGTGLDWQPCPKGTYGSQEGLSSIEQCSNCTGGHYCNSTALTSPSGLCSAGYYCISGVTTATPTSESVGNQELGGECPVAHYCPTGTVHPIRCSAGTYNPLTGQPICFVCPEGFYCLANSTTYTNTPCNHGYYCPNGTKYSEEFACPAGSFNNRTMAKSLGDCISCPPGMYCEGNGLSVPSGECEQGYYCYSGSNTPTPLHTNITMDILNSVNSTNCSCTGNTEEIGGRCWPGTFCPAASGCPLSCLPGMFCDDYELVTPTGPCNEGYYCSGDASSAAPEDSICPQGHYCPEGSSIPTGCPSGTFSSTIGNPNISHCTLCTEGHFCAGIGLSIPDGECFGGYYCPRGQRVADPSNFTCPRGAFCINGSSLPERCPRGFYQLEIGKSSCSSCPSGYFCDPEMFSSFDDTSGVMIGVVDPVICLAGYYCPEETMFSTQFPCPSGTYSNATGLHNKEQCLNCPEEMYCDDEGLTEPTGRCSPGYYCVSKANTSQPMDGLTGNICPKGRYCPQGVSVGIPCPRGTYNNYTGISNVSECMQCLPGYYCDTEGLMEPSGLCVSGYYCSSGALTATPIDILTEGGDICPPGHYCPRGTAIPIPCNAGSYQPSIGAQNISSCLPCEPGSYCNSSGLAESSGLCAAGYYCSLGASVSEPIDGITGNICPAGAECPVGSSTFTSCPDGTYSNSTGVLSCYQCPSGRYCVFMDHTEACLIGFYCPEGTGYNYTGCPVGTYGDQEGLADISECRLCDGGHYCSGTGKMNTSGLCAEGYYCQYGVNISRPSVSSSHTGVGAICPVGHYCPTGSSLPIDCPAGSYANATAQPLCFTCPEGFFCPPGSITGIPCPVGHYCPEGTGSQDENQCPQGTYNNFTGATNEHDCLRCLPGHYCASPGLAEPSGLCDGGYYCSQGSVTPRPTDIDVNFTDFSLICPAAVNATGGICPSGFYCPEGASNPVPCSGGMYCPGVMLLEPFAECREGYFCNISSSTPDQYTCLSGHYCPNGSAYPVPCPSGTFSPAEGNTQLNDCIACTAGMYCAGTGLVTATGNCSEGYYCPSNATSPTPNDFPCPSGHFCPEGSTTPRLCLPGTYQPSSGSGICQDCPSGHYCDPSEGVQALITPPFCSQGFYCPSGTGSIQPACPSGTFGSREGLEALEDCSACTAGLYCEGEALTTPTGSCLAGYFCTGGSDSPTPHDNITVLGNTSELIWNGNGECPVGYYCPEGSRVPTPCPTGSFSQSRAVTNASGCEPCPRGRYCSFTGPVMVTEAPPCSAGYICTGGSSTPTPDSDSTYGYPCPIGHFCLEGALFEVGCPVGEYNPNLAQASCLECPEGMRCPYNNMTTPLNCLPGHYCPNGTSNAIPCPEGTFTQSENLTSAEECSYCVPGSYCGTTGLTEATGPCAAGYYCQRGATSPAPSSADMFPSNGPCATGHYCPEGTVAPIPCPIGTFLDSTGGFNVSSCRPCTGGSFCNTSGLTSPTGFCSLGFYCPGGINHVSTT